MRFGTRIGLALLTALLLNWAFPVGGPLPPWRGVLGMVALVPLLLALLDDKAVRRRRYFAESALVGYCGGVLWYGLNCYWIYATMHQYGGLNAPVSAGIVALFSLILGGYFALFGLLVATMRRGTGRVLWTACAIPFLWVSVEYLAAHLTCVPWDQLGYSQVDNLWLTRLAPSTGVYGISWVLAGVNALWLGSRHGRSPRRRMRFAALGLLATCGLEAGILPHPGPQAAGHRAVLVQPDLRVGANLADENEWVDTPGRPEWTRRTAELLLLSERGCTPYLLGMPEPAPVEVQRVCPKLPTDPQQIGSVRSGAEERTDLVIWPESPSPFRTWDPRFSLLLGQLAAGTGAVSVVGAPSVGFENEIYNAAILTDAAGRRLGEYHKIHLVPWGEYIPFARLFSFAGTLTQNVGRFAHGRERAAFHLPDGHTMGIFICYEAVFADEIRQFARSGAEVFVNISDDGWYGDTSAPWQHLNMARMRAIENRRWMVRDTNSGVTGAIDPLGRVTESMPRHRLGSLAVDYGYRSEQTFYTRYGDVWAWVCAILSVAALGWALPRLRKKHAE